MRRGLWAVLAAALALGGCATYDYGYSTGYYSGPYAYDYSAPYSYGYSPYGYGYYPYYDPGVIVAPSLSFGWSYRDGDRNWYRDHGRDWRDHNGGERNWREHRGDGRESLPGRREVRPSIGDNATVPSGIPGERRYNDAGATQQPSERGR